MDKSTLKKENARLRVWVSDLLSGMYVNCVYCGHRYGPAKDTPVAMAEVLKAHIEICPEHPLSVLRMQYLGVLGLLARSAIGLRNTPEEIADDLRDLFEQALQDARKIGMPIMYNRTLDRINLWIVPAASAAAAERKKGKA